MSRPLSLLACLLAALGASACRNAPPENVAASVNSRPISNEELEKQYKVLFSSDNDSVSEDEVAIRKLEIVRSLIDNEIMLQRAEKLNLMAVESDVESKFTELRAPYTQEEFEKQLKSRNMTQDDLRAQLRRDLSIQKLFNKEITSHITITDQDVADFYNNNKASFNLVEPQIHLAQVLVTPHPDPNVRNLRSDKAQNEEQAKAKISAIEARLRRGEDFAMVAQAFSEDANTAPNGGDLGFIPESSLEQANIELRKVVMALQPGQISGIIRTAEGYRILKVISREPAGQRELEDPRVQQTIRDNLRNRKDQLLRAAYYEVARNDARVVNYFALAIVQRSGADGR
ncbi:MAG: peptidylprolyl isomerase [Bryobacteraceae bacterium]|nr:peptidylprolyl isomerase [Bryobacteraceae bacterium]